MTVTHRGAWVPHAPERSWEDAFTLASECVLEEARSQGRPPLLVTYSRTSLEQAPEQVRRFAARYACVTVHGPQGGGRDVPTVVFTATLAALSLGVARAHGSLLVPVASGEPDQGLLGWALEVAALDLTTGLPTPDTRSEAVRTSLPKLLALGGTGWSGGADRDAALMELDALAQVEALDPEVVCGFMLAHGKHDVAVRNLWALVDKVRG